MKAFVMNEEQLLFVKENTTGKFWELPGGRIDVGEEFEPSTAILRRELAEELGPDFRCDIVGPAVTWVRQFPKLTGEFIFFVGYACQYVSGTIVLNHEHAEYRWVTRHEIGSLPIAASYDLGLDQFWKSR